MQEKPKTCPFCGGMPEVYTDGELCCIVDECPINRRYMDPIEWNRRTPGPATAKMLAWLKNEIILTPYDFDELSVAFRAEAEGQGVPR